MPSWLEQRADSLATIDGVQRHQTTNITPENIFVYFCSERSEAYFCIRTGLFFLVKNTPSMRATKIIKNMSMGVVLRQFLSNYCQFLSMQGY